MSKPDCWMTPDEIRDKAEWERHRDSVQDLRDHLMICTAQICARLDRLCEVLEDERPTYLEEAKEAMEPRPDADSEHRLRLTYRCGRRSPQGQACRLASGHKGPHVSDAGGHETESWSDEPTECVPGNVPDLSEQPMQPLEYRIGLSEVRSKTVENLKEALTSLSPIAVKIGSDQFRAYVTALDLSRVSPDLTVDFRVTDD